MSDVVDGLKRIPTTFSIRDERAHKALKRQVANAFLTSSLVELEPRSDYCTAILLGKLNGMQDRDIDFGIWLHWYAFDVISSITFSSRLGFMETKTDVAGIIAGIEGRLMYNSVVGQVPALHRFLLGNQ